MALGFTVTDHVATVTLNRPEAMNALDYETMDELAAAFATIQNDNDIRVAILTGTGERAFCTGADLKKVLPGSTSFAEQTFGELNENPALKYETDKPVLCAINGLAYGGGLELALSCDLRIAADTAKFALPEVRIGSIPGAGGTQRLPRAVGIANAMHMLLTGDPIDAAEALRIGLVSRVVPYAELPKAAADLAARIAANAPLSVRAIKRLVTLGREIPLKAAVHLERTTFGVLRDTEDRIEGRKAFKEKRPPVYRGK